MGLLSKALLLFLSLSDDDNSVVDGEVAILEKSQMWWGQTGARTAWRESCLIPCGGDKSLPSTSLLSAKTVRSTVKHGKGEEKTVVQRELEQIKESIHVCTSFFSK